MKTWGDKDHPIERFKAYIVEKGWWNEEDEKNWQKEVIVSYCCMANCGMMMVNRQTYISHCRCARMC